MKSWLKKKLSEQNALKKDSWIFSVLGDRILAPELWRFNRHSLAGGFALGIFVAFTPTFGIQLLLAAFFAIIIRVNLPAALLSCFITNPFTIAPIYYFCFQVGALFIKPEKGFPEIDITSITFTDFINTYTIADAVTYMAILWLGCLIVAIISALVTHMSVHALWRLDVMSRWKKRRVVRSDSDCKD
jgi:uncharacterized protein